MQDIGVCDAQSTSALMVWFRLHLVLGKIFSYYMSLEMSRWGRAHLESPAKPNICIKCSSNRSLHYFAFHPYVHLLIKHNMSFQNICSPNCGHILWSVPFPSIYLPPARISRPSPHFKNPSPPTLPFPLMPPLSLHSSGRVLTSDRNLPISALHLLTISALCRCLCVMNCKEYPSDWTISQPSEEVIPRHWQGMQYLSI